MAEKTRVCWTTVIRPVLIERRSQAVTAPSRMNRMSKTGRCVVPPSISGAKTVRPPRTTREPKAGKERRAAGSSSGSIPHITNPKLLSDLQTQARGLPAPRTRAPCRSGLQRYVVAPVGQVSDIVDLPEIRRGGGEATAQIRRRLRLRRLGLIGHEVRDGDRRQDPDDRDHDHQLDQGKAPIPFHVSDHQRVLLFSESYTLYDRASELPGRTFISFLHTRSARRVPSPYEQK